MLLSSPLIAVLILLPGIPFLYVGILVLWKKTKTRGLRYYGMSPTERKKFKEKLRFYSKLAMPILKFLAFLTRFKKLPSIKHNGMLLPAAKCSNVSVAKTESFLGEDGDVIVASHIKCGTTWLQQIVFEILNKGGGDFSTEGLRHMQAVSPWLESSEGREITDTHGIGPSKRRLIKTHLPPEYLSNNCPAKIIYISRNPLSAFASFCDFISLVSGPFSPRRDQLLDWYCSDEMWWKSWPEHHSAWWKKAAEDPNVLIIQFEELKADLSDNLVRISAFLDVELKPNELSEVARKSSFEYMKENENYFEMNAPNFFTVTKNGGSFLPFGSVDRGKDTSEKEAKQIIEFCKNRLLDSGYTFDDYLDRAKRQIPPELIRDGISDS